VWQHSVPANCSAFLDGIDIYFADAYVGEVSIAACATPCSRLNQRRCALIAGKPPEANADGHTRTRHLLGKRALPLFGFLKDALVPPSVQLAFARQDAKEGGER
jgi:hypothetical protein